VVTDSAEIAALVAEHGGSILGHGNPDVVFAGPATPPTYTAERLAELAQRQEAARKRAAAPEPLTLDAVIAELATIEDRDKRRALARQSVPKLGMSKEIELTWRDALRTNGGLPVAEFDALRKDAAGTSSRRSGPRLVGPADQAITHRLSDDVFQQVPGVGLFKVSGKQPIKLLPGELTVPGVVEVRDLTPELAPGDPSDTVFRVRYAPAGQDSAREVSVSAEDMLNRQPEWPRRTGAAGRTPKRHLDSIGDAIRAMGQTIEQADGWPAAYGSTGLLLRPGQPAVFLRRGAPALTATGLDATASCVLPGGFDNRAGVAALSLDDPAEGAELVAGLELLLRWRELAPEFPGLGMALLCQLAWAPVANLPNAGPTNLVLGADSGTMKTAVAGLVVAAQSRTFIGGPGVEVPPTVDFRHGRSSGPGLNRVLYPLGGLVALADDWFAGKLTGKQIAEQWEALSALGNNAATGNGPTLAERTDGKSLRDPRYPRACILATAEGLPDEREHASEVARYAAFVLPAGSVDPAVLTELQQAARLQSGAHAAHVRRMLGDLAPVNGAPWRALAAAAAEVGNWTAGGHRRVRQGYVKLLAGAHLLAGTLDAAGLDGLAFFAAASAALESAAADQARRMGITRAGSQVARNPVRLFVDHFREIIENDAFYLADADSLPGAWLAPRIDGRGPGVCGWQQRGTSERLEWNPAGDGDPLGAVHVYSGKGRRPRFLTMLTIRPDDFRRFYPRLTARITAKTGWTMPSDADMLRQLAEAGYLASVKPSTTARWRAHPDCLAFDYGRMLDGDQDGPELGPVATEPAPAPMPAPTLAATLPGVPADAPSTCDQPAGPRAGTPPTSRSAREAASLSLADQPSLDRQLASLAEATRSGRAPIPATDTEIRTALRAWHNRTGGAWIEATPGLTGLRLYHKLISQHGASVALTRLSEPSAAEVKAFTSSGRLLTGPFNHIRPNVQVRAGQYCTGLDVNTMYLAAASSTLIGDGDPLAAPPELLAVPESLAKFPCYARLGVDLHTDHWLFGTIPAGVVIPHPLLVYLTRDRGLTPVLTAALYWSSSGARFKSWTKPVRRAVTELAARDDVPGLVARRYAKITAHAFLGGMIRSERFNRTEVMRVDAAHMIVSQAFVNMARGLDKVVSAEGSGPVLIGTMIDTAWFVSDQAEPARPAELTFSRDPGKWKTERSAELTLAMVDRIERRQAGRFRDLFNEANRLRIRG
jgi:hypothetical protein